MSIIEKADSCLEYPEVIDHVSTFSAASQRNLKKQKGADQEVRNSPFDSIKRPPSVTMEKIKATTAAALDRMSLLQQRYRQHQETMKSDSEKSRRTSTTSSLMGDQVSYLHYVTLFCLTVPPKAF